MEKMWKKWKKMKKVKKMKKNEKSKKLLKIKRKITYNFVLWQYFHRIKLPRVLFLYKKDLPEASFAYKCDKHEAMQSQLLLLHGYFTEQKHWRIIIADTCGVRLQSNIGVYRNIA